MRNLAALIASHRPPDRRTTRWLAVGVILITILVFVPSLSNGFVDWDDDVNLTKNLWYRGFSWVHVRWMFTSTLMGHYIPVTWLSFAADHAVWGMNPMGYHLTNVVLHGLNAGLVFLIALRLFAYATTWPITTRHLGAGMAALFFALHPLRAESVAWVTERRDVLSGCFALLAIFGYLAAHDRSGRERRIRLIASLVAFGLALFSKSIVMGLPLVLLVLDIYPLRRISATPAGLMAGRSVVLEKVPYAALGAIGAAIAYYSVHSNAFLTSMEVYPWPARIAMAFYSFWFYAVTTALPVGLSPLYELPASLSPLEPRFLVPMVAVCMFTAVAIAVRRRWPAFLAVWATYVIMLGPVSGIVHSGFQLAHDRYSYLSCIGWALLAGAGLVVLLQAGRDGYVRPALARAGAAAAAAWLLALATLTWHQVQVWKDSESLWSYARDIDEKCAICHGNLGVLLTNQGKPHAGLQHIERALALRPDRLRTHANLGAALMRLDRRKEAIEHFRIVLDREPNHVDVLCALGVALLRDGNVKDAFVHFDRAVTLEPTNVIARANRATALVQLGERSAALQEYGHALTLDPTSTAARYGLGWALARFGEREAAREQVTLLRGIDPVLATRLHRDIETEL